MWTLVDTPWETVNHEQWKGPSVPRDARGAPRSDYYLDYLDRQNYYLDYLARVQSRITDSNNSPNNNFDDHGAQPSPYLARY